MHRRTRCNGPADPAHAAGGSARREAVAVLLTRESLSAVQRLRCNTPPGTTPGYPGRGTVADEAPDRVAAPRCPDGHPVQRFGG
jgi:hypothetical protein